jgi:hypothetical protein
MAKTPFIIAPIHEEPQVIQCPVECLLTKFNSFPRAEQERQASIYILISLMAILMAVNNVRSQNCAKRVNDSLKVNF